MLTAAVQSKVQRSGLGAPNVPLAWVAPASLRAPVAPLRGISCRVAQDDIAVPATEASAAVADAPSGKIPLSELVQGQVYEGTVKSVAAYGAFVDIGSTTDGLVHISQLSHGYVKDVNDHISPGQKVNVVLLKIEGQSKLSLSMKAATPESEADKTERQEREGGGGQRAPRRGRASAAPQHSLEVGQEVSGIVNKVVGFGAFVKLEDGFEVLLPTVEMSGAADELDPNPFQLVTANAAIKGTVTRVDRNKVAITNMTKEERSGAADAGVEKSEAPVMLGGSLMNDLSGLDNAALQAMVAALPSSKSVAVPADPEEAASTPAEEEAAPAEEAATEATSEAAPAVEETPAGEDTSKAEAEAAAAADAEAEAAAKAEADAQAAAAVAEAEAAAKAALDEAEAKAAEADAAAKVAEDEAAAEAAASAAAEEATPAEVSPKPE